MKSREALKVLAEVSESQWGMVTSAQANGRGVSHMNLTRLTESGDLVRLSHGVYKDAGAPGGVGTPVCEGCQDCPCLHQLPNRRPCGGSHQFLHRPGAP